MSTNQVKFPLIREELLKMYEKDQYVRIHGDFNQPSTSLGMAKVDLKHQKRLVKILDIIKTPSIKNIGLDGAEVVWIIAQHAGFNLSLMKQVQELMEKCTSKDVKNGYYRGIAYLTDRINVMEGNNQVYGTQFWASPNGVPEPYPIVDFENIDERRKKFGLESFNEYKKYVVEASELTKRPVYHIVY